MWRVTSSTNACPGAARGARRDRFLRSRVGRDTSRSRAHARAFMADPHAMASGCTGASTMAAGCPTASWSSSAADTQVKVSVFASRSGRSKTDSCERLASPTCSRGHGRAAGQKRLVAFYCGERHLDATCCGSNWVRRFPIHDSVISIGGRTAANRNGKIDRTV